MSWLIIAKVTFVFALAQAALFGMRGSSASSRHMVVFVALLAAVLLPVFELVVPAWEVLPRSSLTTAEETFQPVPAAASLEFLSPIAVEASVPAAKPTSVAIPLHQWLAVAWLLGTCSLLILLLVRFGAMTLAVQQARTYKDPHWQAALATASAAIGFNQSVELRLRDQCRMPLAWGIRHPVILLPADCGTWSESRRRDVLAHELAHVARRDVLILTLGHIACAMHWFNPLAWFLKHRLAVECEHACDDLALTDGTSAPGYADHLLTTAVNYREHHSLAPVMAARSLLEGRIMAILDNNRNRRQASPRVQLGIITLAAVALVPLSSVTWAQAKEAWVEAKSAAQQYSNSDSANFADHLKGLGVDRADTNVLLAGLEAQSALTRAASAWALGNSKDEAVIDPLIRAGSDTEAIVRQWAVRSLGNWDAPRIAGPLVARLGDNDAEVRQWAARSLQRHDDAAKTQPLIDALGDNNSEVREWAVRALAQSEDPRVPQAFAGRLAVETSADVSEWIVRGLGGRGDARSAEVLIGALYNNSSDVRQWAVRGLAGYQDDRTTDALINMLNDEDAEVREWSARGLGYCGNARAVAPLQAMSQDANGDVREWVDRALKSINC